MTSLASDGEPKGREQGEQYDKDILHGFFDINEKTLHFGCKNTNK